MPEEQIAIEDLLAEAWGVIANAGLHRGGWDHEHPDWVEAAEKWRDDYLRWMGRTAPMPEAGKP